MENQTLQPIPYLFFDGTCAEAMDFYGEVLGGKVAYKMTYGEMPGDYPCPDEAKSRIMNAMLELPGGGLLYASDSFPGKGTGAPNGFMVALNYADVAKAEEVFNRLAEGGQVGMPFGPTFWAEKFGMTTDKFGIEWAINGNLNVQL